MAATTLTSLAPGNQTCRPGGRIDWWLRHNVRRDITATLQPSERASERASDQRPPVPSLEPSQRRQHLGMWRRHTLCSRLIKMHNCARRPPGLPSPLYARVTEPVFCKMQMRLCSSRPSRVRKDRWDGGAFVTCPWREVCVALLDYRHRTQPSGVATGACKVIRQLATISCN